MSSLKPITLYGAKSGPNPWKIVTIFEELNIPYKIDFKDGATKEEAFLALNPNGRVPAIEDPNTGVLLWESGAIADYLVETYDKEHKLTYTTSPEKFYVKQWAAFQISGQGPYFGQAWWFTFAHPEKFPSAIERYMKEIERVIGVVELHLSRTGSKYLVGDKLTYADIMFVPWFKIVKFLDKENKILGGGKYRNYEEWIQRLDETPSVKKTFEEKAKVSDF